MKLAWNPFNILRKKSINKENVGKSEPKPPSPYQVGKDEFTTEGLSKRNWKILDLKLRINIFDGNFGDPQLMYFKMVYSKFFSNLIKNSFKVSCENYQNDFEPLFFNIIFEYISREEDIVIMFENKIAYIVTFKNIEYDNNNIPFRFDLQSLDGKITWNNKTRYDEDVFLLSMYWDTKWLYYHQKIKELFIIMNQYFRDIEISKNIYHWENNEEITDNIEIFNKQVKDFIYTINNNENVRWLIKNDDSKVAFSQFNPLFEKYKVEWLSILNHIYSFLGIKGQEEDAISERNNTMESKKSLDMSNNNYLKMFEDFKKLEKFWNKNSNDKITIEKRESEVRENQEDNSFKSDEGGILSED